MPPQGMPPQGMPPQGMPFGDGQATGISVMAPDNGMGYQEEEIKEEYPNPSINKHDDGLHKGKQGDDEPEPIAGEPIVYGNKAEEEPVMGVPGAPIGVPLDCDVQVLDQYQFQINMDHSPEVQ